MPGTPAYMAPEMATGDSFDGRVDLYALGCVGYYLLTGELVFEAETPLAMIGRHLRTQPLPPSIRSGRAIGNELDQVILACLAKEPEGRPASANELSRRLAELGLPEWSAADARAWWDAHLGTARRVPSAEVPDSWPTRVEVRIGSDESS
jgi:serine/threonine-protein kinase